MISDFKSEGVAFLESFILSVSSKTSLPYFGSAATADGNLRILIS